MGHSKVRCALAGYVVEITQLRILPGLVGLIPMLFPTMTGDMGLQLVDGREFSGGSGAWG
jgi:hypothetical protein